MTFSRAEYKNNAKKFLQNNYLICFLVCLIVVFFSSSDFDFSFNLSTEGSEASVNLFGVTISNLSHFLPAITFMAVFLFIISFAVKILIANPFKCSQKYFFLKNCRDENQGNIKDLLFAFKSNYKNIVFVSFITNLIISVGFLLFIIPGIIFSYMFRFVPYILADNPDISLSDALNKSKEMTNNIKIDLFVFDLSFILWYILASIINGISNLIPFFNINVGSCLLAPYTEQTFALVYDDIRSKDTLC